MGKRFEQRFYHRHMNYKQVHEKMLNVYSPGKYKFKVTMRYHYTHTLNQLKLKRLTIAGAREDLEKLNLSDIADENANYTVTLENNLSILNYLNIFLPHDSTDLPVGMYISTYVHAKIFPRMFTAVHFLITKNGNNLLYTYW